MRLVVVKFLRTNWLVVVARPAVLTAQSLSLFLRCSTRRQFQHTKSIPNRDEAINLRTRSGIYLKSAEGLSLIGRINPHQLTTQCQCQDQTPRGPLPMQSSHSRKKRERKRQTSPWATGLNILCCGVVSQPSTTLHQLALFLSTNNLGIV